MKREHEYRKLEPHFVTGIFGINVGFTNEEIERYDSVMWEILDSEWFTVLAGWLNYPRIINIKLL